MIKISSFKWSYDCWYSFYMPFLKCPWAFICFALVVICRPLLDVFNFNTKCVLIYRFCKFDPLYIVTLIFLTRKISNNRQYSVTSFVFFFYTRTDWPQRHFTSWSRDLLATLQMQHATSIQDSIELNKHISPKLAFCWHLVIWVFFVFWDE